MLLEYWLRYQNKICKMDFSRKQLALSSVELAQMRKDFWQAWIGIGLVLLIGAGFTFMFYSNVPHAGVFQLLFAFSPLIACISVVLYLIYHLIKNWRDIQVGYKILEVGKITDKFIKANSRSSQSSFTSSTEYIRHYIRVNGKHFLIKVADYDRCKIGHTAYMYITPYALEVMNIEFRL